MAVPASASSAVSGAFFTSNVPSACRETGPSFAVVWEWEACAVTRVGIVNHPVRSRKMMVPISVRRTISPSVNEEIVPGEWRAGDEQSTGWLFGELEDSDLHKFRDSEVLEAAVL